MGDDLLWIVDIFRLIRGVVLATNCVSVPLMVKHGIPVVATRGPALY